MLTALRILRFPSSYDAASVHEQAPCLSLHQALQSNLAMMVGYWYTRRAIVILPMLLSPMTGLTLSRLLSYTSSIGHLSSG